MSRFLPALGALLIFCPQGGRSEPPKAQAPPGKNELPALVVNRCNVPAAAPASGEFKRGSATAIAFTADSKAVVAATDTDHVLFAWDLAAGKIKWQTKPHRRDFACLTCSQDGKMVCALESSGGEPSPGERVIRIYDQQSGTLTGSWSANEDRFTCVAFSPDGKLLATWGYFTGTAIWDAALGKPVLFDPQGRQPLKCAIDFSRDGRQIGAIWATGNADVYDWHDRTSIHTTIGSFNELGNGYCHLVRLRDSDTFAWVEFPPFENSWQAAARRRAYVYFWNQEAKPPTRRVTIPRAFATASSAISPDGRILACGVSGKKTNVMLFDVESGRNLVDLKGQADLKALCFSPDASLLATAALDSTIIVWNMREARFAGYWSWLAAREESDQKAGADKIAAESAEWLPRLRKHVERLADSYDRLLPVMSRLDDAAFAHRDSADRDLRTRFEEVEACVRIFREGDRSAEARRRIDAMLPDLTPREKELRGGFPLKDPQRRQAELKRIYGDDYMIYPDSPGAAEFRSLSRVFPVLERIDSPDVKPFLESLAKRPAGDWFAIKAAESLKRMKR